MPTTALTEWWLWVGQNAWRSSNHQNAQTNANTVCHNLFSLWTSWSGGAWQTHKQSIIEDFIHFLQVSTAMAEQYALSHIQSILKESSLSCADFGLPHTGDIIDVGEICPTDNNLDELRQSEAIMASLNEDQRALVDSILQAIDTITSGCPPKCHAYFLDGPGGSGKTRVYNTLISYLNCKHIKVASAAWTGIAATLLMGGRTVHNLFKLPVPILDTSTCNISPSSPHAHYLRLVMLFIIDEASMVPVHALSAIDKMMRDITNVDVPFGAKIFLLGGDFRQVLPVVPRSSRTVIVEHCLKSSPLWPLFTVHRLKKNMRAKENESEFANWLMELGNGTLPSPDHETFPNAIKIPDTCNIVQSDIVTEVFSDITDVQALADRVILTPTNTETLKLNNHVLDKLPGETEVYFSVDKAVCDTEEAANYPHGVLEQYNTKWDATTWASTQDCCNNYVAQEFRYYKGIM